jgi:hypothetical protein
MEKISHYTMVHATEIKALIENVNEGIEKGYEPFGSVFSGRMNEGPVYFQPMVKTASDKTPPEFRAAMGR